MRVAIYGKRFSAAARPYVEQLYHKLRTHAVEIAVYHELHDFISRHCDFTDGDWLTFQNHGELSALQPDFLITLGGDGTILDAVTLVRDSQIPILGINTGRLGFLSNVGKEELESAVDAILQGHYSLDPRMVLQCAAEGADWELDFALNEVTVSRKNTTSMLTTHVWINNEFLASYWADGLIIATPTGSTGYSLSCGGPIIMPGSENFVLTPIAPHNLNLRPFVIPNHLSVKLQVEARERQHLVSLDSRLFTIDSGTFLHIELGGFRVNLIRTELQNFPQTLRNKLFWGVDKRN